jgi:glycosyltransferase involved in cell wall biosynthesis
MSLQIPAIIALTLAAIPALMCLWNLPQLKRLARRKEGPRECSCPLPPLSVLVPARNESANIRGALTSMLGNQGVDFEIIVLDDHSEDDTASIVREFAHCDPRVRLESAPPLPAGWCGKQHACHVLSKHAHHPLLVFMDADVRLAPDALARMSDFMTCKGNKARQHSESANILKLAPALASGVPRQVTDTLVEKLLIPLIHFVLLGFLPVWRMRRCTKPAYGAGCGQLFIAEAAAYHASGGHASIRNSLHDGLKLPRAFRRAGFKTDLFDATDVASCRMYQNGREVVEGLTKNAHEGLASSAQIGPWTVLLFGGQVLPWILLAFGPWLETRALGLCLAACALTLLPRALAAWRFRQSGLGILLHPLAIAVFLAIQWHAFIRAVQQRPQTWKGRTYCCTSNSPPNAATSRPGKVSIRSV